MKEFETPVIKTVVLESKDVIATSAPDVDNDGFNNEVVKP